MTAWKVACSTSAFLACLLAAAQEPGKQQEAALSLRLTDEVIGKAVRETLAEQARSPTVRDKTLSGESYDKFARAFSEAEKPSCLGPDATRFQPAQTTVKTADGGWNVGLGGIFVLPFWAAAIVRGKCK